MWQWLDLFIVVFIFINGMLFGAGLAVGNYLWYFNGIAGLILIGVAIWFGIEGWKEK